MDDDLPPLVGEDGEEVEPAAAPASSPSALAALGCSAPEAHRTTMTRSSPSACAAWFRVVWHPWVPGDAAVMRAGGEEQVRLSWPRVAVDLLGPQRLPGAVQVSAEDAMHAAMREALSGLGQRRSCKAGGGREAAATGARRALELGNCKRCRGEHEAHGAGHRQG